MRRHRHAARLTLERLAEASGVSARTLSDLERGRSRGPQHRTVIAIADGLALGEVAREQLVELAKQGRLRDHWTRPTGLCELPRAVDDFTGRAAELAWTNDLAPADVGLITGPAGLGKTTLAVRAAHAMRPGFPDGVLFVDLFGMSRQPLAVDEALRLLLRALGVADQQIPDDGLGRASRYRSLLRDRRVLVVLDNAASEEQTRPLLPAGGASRALVTSRRLLAGLEGVRRLSLGPLPVAAATELLTGILGDRGASDDESALTRLAQLCGGLPLALRIIGNRLVSRPGWNAADLAARLANEDRRLAQLSAGDLKIATAFGMSYEQLVPAARRVFRRLALVPGRDFDAALAAVAGEIAIEDAWDVLDELVDLGLLQDGPSGRYRFHDLVLLFARDRLQEEDTPAERDAVVETMASWLLRTATTAGRWFEPGYGSPDRPDPGLSSLAEADHWLRVNADNWLGALRHAASSGPAASNSAVLDCAESMHWFSDRWMHWPHWREIFTLGAQAAAALGDRAQQATQLNYVAWTYLLPPPGDPETAIRYAKQALDLATLGGTTAQIAWAHQYAATALRRLGRLDEAAASASRAAQTFRAIGDVDAYCQCVGTVGACLLDNGRYAEALERFREMCDLAGDEESGMTPTIAAYTRPVAMGRIGHCQGLLGRRAEAITTLTEATGLMDNAPLTTSHPNCLEILAGFLGEEGRTGESRRAYARAAELYEAIGQADASRRCRDLAADAG